MKPRRVRRDLVERDARLPLGLAGRPFRDEAAEVLVTGPVFYEESDPRKLMTGGLGDLVTGGLGAFSPSLPVSQSPSLFLIQRDFRAHQRADSGGVGGFVEARRAVDAVAVHESHGRQTQSRRLLDEILGKRRAVQEREGGGDAQFRVRPGTPVEVPDVPVALLEPLLACPRRDDERRVGGSDVARRDAQIPGRRTAGGAVGRPESLVAHPPILWRNKGVNQLERIGLSSNGISLLSSINAYHFVRRHALSS